MSFVELPSPIPSVYDVAIPLISPVQEGPPDLIPGFLPRHGTLVIAGETNIGKSLVALEAVSSLITGKPLWGELQPNKQLKKVLYILGEHHNETIQRLWQHTKLPMNDQVLLLGPEALGYDKWLVTGGKPNLQAINKFKKWAEGMDLLVFDPFSSFVCGADAENDNLTMRLVLDSMGLISQSVDASCLVLAHQGKPQIDQFGQERSRKSYAIRGASAIEDAATNIFYMGKALGHSEAAIRSSSDAQILALTKRKYKGEAPNEFRLLRDEGTLTHTLLGNRPFVDVRRIATQAKVGKLQAAFPEMPFEDVIKCVSALQDVSTLTIKRDLGMVK